MRGNKTLIPIAALVVFTTITFAELQANDRLPGTDQLLGFTLAFFMLSAMSDLGLPVAGGLAVLLMVSTLLVRGRESIDFAMNTVRRERAKRLRQNRRTSPRSSTPSFAPEAQPVLS
jgi:hypothetical protein